MFLDGGLPLPQYSKYGRSLVLVGGALQDNNTEIYNTIIAMAVSMTLVCSWGLMFLKQKRSIEGCSQLKSSETSEVQERLIST